MTLSRVRLVPASNPLQELAPSRNRPGDNPLNGRAKAALADGTPSAASFASYVRGKRSAEMGTTPPPRGAQEGGSLLSAPWPLLSVVALVALFAGASRLADRPKPPAPLSAAARLAQAQRFMVEECQYLHGLPVVVAYEQEGTITVAGECLRAPVASLGSGR